MPTKRALFVALSLAALVALLQSVPAEAGAVAGKRAAQLTGWKAAALGGDCCAPKEVCCPKPCITYHHCGPKLCCGCEPPKEITLKVKNPCTGCEVDVPVCLPACCDGEPEVCAGTGLFCRDVVDYEWCCGFRVRVVFKHCGDLLVKTWGR